MSSRRGTRFNEREIQCYVFAYIYIHIYTHKHKNIEKDQFITVFTGCCFSFFWGLFTEATHACRHLRAEFYGHISKATDIPEHVGLLLSSLLGLGKTCIFSHDLLKDQNHLNVYNSYSLSLSLQLMCFHAWNVFLGIRFNIEIRPEN